MTGLLEYKDVRGEGIAMLRKFRQMDAAHAGCGLSFDEFRRMYPSREAIERCAKYLEDGGLVQINQPGIVVLTGHGARLARHL